MKINQILILPALLVSLSLGTTNKIVANPITNNTVKAHYPLSTPKKVLKEFEESYHPGIRLAGKKGSLVRVAMGGKISAWSNQISFARKKRIGMVTVDHGDGLQTRYIGLGNIEAKLGDTVEAGQKIGNLNEDYLFFAVRKDGTLVNPIQFIDF